MIAPVEVKVRLMGCSAEAQLMSALDELVDVWARAAETNGHPEDSIRRQTARAVTWLAAKYGNGGVP